MKKNLKRIAIAVVALMTIACGMIVVVPVTVMIYLNHTPRHTVDEVKWLPPTANVLFFADNHGGLHGDGTTFLTFTTTHDSIASLISTFSRTHRISWETNQLDAIALQTVDGAAYNLKVPLNMKPNSASDTYIIGHREPFQGLYYDLIVIDTNKQQVWYLNITT